MFSLSVVPRWLDDSKKSRKPSASPRREEAAASAAARVDLTLDSDDDFDDFDDFDAFECDAPPRKAPRVALENVSNR